MILSPNIYPFFKAHFGLFPLTMTDPGLEIRTVM
jgi:hypothetical protein